MQGSRRHAAALLALGAALLLAGCASTPRSWPPGLPPQLLLEQVPFFAQEDYECGPAALAMAMQAAGLPLRPEQLVPQVYVPGRQGSLQPELLAASRRHGLVPYRLAPRLEALLQELAAGHPVLVFQNLGLDALPVWHYALLIGADRERGELILHSGRTPRQPISLRAFENTWGRGGHWALVVLPPTQLPASIDDARTAAAAIAPLERLQPAAAGRAYASALQRWPGQPLLLLGAGNSAYAQGERAAALQAYRAAAQADPAAADAWNNQAQVLLELGRRAEARAAIERAIALGGPRLAQYQGLAARIEQEESGGARP